MTVCSDAASAPLAVCMLQLPALPCRRRGRQKSRKRPLLCGEALKGARPARKVASLARTLDGRWCLEAAEWKAPRMLLTAG